MKIKQAIITFFYFTTLMLTLLFSAKSIAKNDVAHSKINELIDVLEKKRIEHHIPGMAISVVKDNKVILAQGFGLMDLDKKIPVTSDTLFSIGSSSKAFTATMLGMMVDQEKLDWDQLVTDQLPEYQFKVNGELLPITYRDMLAHRTGYTRNDLLWANGQASREKILATATLAEPVDEFRKNFYYNNVMYLAAGEAMAQVAGQSWDQLLDDMLLRPLGMSNSTSVHENALSNPKISQGYQWNEEAKQHDLLPRRNLNNVSPAGGIYSNVNDMAQWVRFQLNQGKVSHAQDSEQLISIKQLKQTHNSQINITGGVDYGLGWMLRKWQNQNVVEHGGNIDGYAAQVALLPESNLGFVLLTNVTATPLQQESMGIVWEHFVDTAVEKTSQTGSTGINYQDYVGEYRANFGPFKDAIFTFLVKEDGIPALDVPGQTVYELLDPDVSGKWFFKLTNTISISFERDESNEVVVMRMQQNGADFELPRKGYEIKPEVDVSTFNQFLGLYDSKKLNGKIRAFIQNHRLTMDVPNQMAYELHLPDENGFRQFRIKPDTSVKFVTDESGEVTAVELYVNKERLVETVPKVENLNEVQLPTLKDVMALRKTTETLEALKNNSGFMLSGEVNVKSSGITGRVTTKFDDDMSVSQVMDFGVFGKTVNVVNKDTGATYGIGPYRELKGKYLKQAQRDSPAVSIDWEKYYDEIKVLALTEVNDKEVIEVRLKEEGLPATTAYVDRNTGDVLQWKMRLLIPSVGSVNVSVDYDDFRNQHDMRMPFKATINNPMMGEIEIKYDEFKANQKFAGNEFDTSNPN